MEEFQQRVVAEKEQLDDRRGKLEAFIDSHEAYAGLPIPEKSRLVRQVAIMGLYSQVLFERVAAFPKPLVVCDFFIDKGGIEYKCEVYEVGDGCVEDISI